MSIFAIAKHNNIVWPLACVAAVAMIFISEASYWQSAATLDKLGEMGAARSSIQGLQQSILAAETGQRGYLLTNRKEYLQPYEKSIKDIDESFRFLGHYYDKEEQSGEVLKQLHGLTTPKLSELAVAIQLHDEGKSAASTDIVLSELNKKQMDAIRKISTQLLDREAQKVKASRDDIYRTLLLSRIGMGALSAISLLALFMYLRQTLALKRQQQELQRLVQLERQRLEIEVIQRTAQLTELTRHLLTAREDERNRLARNLHDDLGALLTSAKLDAARIKSRLADKAPEALELLSHLVGTLNSSIALGRDIIENLRPSALSNLGLVATLEILTREFAEQSGVEVHCSLEAVQLEATAELMIYRLVQEAITNITKYARAKSVWVRLATEADQVIVSVRDDGIGFDTDVASRSAYGLVGMRFRVEAEGGTLAVVSGPGQGTRIEAKLPKLTSAV